MDIGILSRKQSLYSTRRLKEEGERRGHAVRVIDYLRCYMNITAHKPQVMFVGASLKFDAIIPKIGASHTFYGTAIVRQFEMMDVFTMNSSQAISRSRDKLRALQLLSKKGIGLPVTGFAHSTKDIEGLLNVVGNAPVIIKLLEGTQGIGVVLAETKKAAESVITAFRQLDANILVQEFIAEADGSDIRALVLGGKVIAAMKRRSKAGDFRSNLHRGGLPEKVKLTLEERRTAARAAKAMGLNMAGVDIIRTKHGPAVLEVNSSPGLKGIEKATGINVAAKIIQSLEERVAQGNRGDKIQG